MVKHGHVLIFFPPVGSHFFIFDFGPYICFCLYICPAFSDQLMVVDIKMLHERNVGHAVFSDVLESVL